MEIMQLINEARETDFDIESEIDWDHDSYETAKERIYRKKEFRDILLGGY